MRTRFKEHLSQRFPFIKGKRILLAISGGMDSVVLGDLCQNSELDFALAHCNFSLREKESDEDEIFVRNLGEKWGKTVFVKKFDTQKIAAEIKCSIQVTARELRYEWFEMLAEQSNFDYIFTAHQTDDNLETFLINTLRGTGLEGLTGIPEINGKILRPLLPFSRKEIEFYAKLHKISWREDSSNASSKYLRNKMRHQVIPILKKENPDLLESFKKTQDHLQDSSDLLIEYQSVLLREIVEEKGEVLEFNIQKIQEKLNPKAVLYYLLKDFGFTAWEDIHTLLTSQTGKIIFSPSHRLLKNRGMLVLSKNSSEESENKEVVIQEFNSEIHFELGQLLFESAQKYQKSGKDQIYVDKNSINFPLKLRKWKESDYFYPFGMDGKKKLSNYLKDEKFSLFDKEKIWVLTSEEKIVWIVGQRADERFRINSENSNILRILFLPKSRIPVPLI